VKSILIISAICPSLYVLNHLLHLLHISWMDQSPVTYVITMANYNATHMLSSPSSHG